MWYEYFHGGKYFRSFEIDIIRATVSTLGSHHHANLQIPTWKILIFLDYSYSTKLWEQLTTNLYQCSQHTPADSPEIVPIFHSELCHFYLREDNTLLTLFLDKANEIKSHWMKCLIWLAHPFTGKTAASHPTTCIFIYIGVIIVRSEVEAYVSGHVLCWFIAWAP